MGKGKLKNLKNGRMMYDDDPGCKYLVIENPWPFFRVPSSRDNRWFDHVGAWLWYATDKAFLPDEVLYIGTKNEVIVKFSDKLDVSRLLGRHEWSKICLKPEDKAPPRGPFSYIFEYDYGMKGHPDDHQWLSYALPDLTVNVPLQNGALPIRQPYPPPEWADCKDRMRSCRDLALPMPIDKPKAREQPEQPKASAAPQGPENLTQPPQPASIFSGLAQHIPDRPQQATTPSSAIPSNDPSQPPSGRLYTGKLDPEYEEAAAARLLKSEPRDEKVSVVKAEASLGQGPNHDPSPDVLAQYEVWRRSMGAQSADVKQEPGHMEGFTVKVEPGLVKAEVTDSASEEIRRLHAEYEKQRSAGNNTGELSVKREDSLPHRIKPEPEVGSPLSRPGGSNVKPELLDVGIREESITRVMDPRRRDLPRPSNGKTAVKRENDTHNQDYDVKRIKTE